MRYDRHITIPEIGIQGQQKLLDARILMIGAGGLGCAALQYLAAAGVGTIGIIDGDLIDESNLQRQILYATDDIGKQKVDVAKERLCALNPDLTVDVYAEYFTAENAQSIVTQYDIVIDGTDNFSTRYLVNDVCVKCYKPFIYGAVHKFQGQVSVFNFENGPTYRCLFPQPVQQGQIPNCTDLGVLGVLPGIIGSFQAAEAIKLILRIGQPLSGKLKVLDLLTNTEQIIEFTPNQEEVMKAREMSLSKSNSDANCSTVKGVNANEMMSWIENRIEINFLDVREPHETPKLQHSNVICMPLGQLPNLHSQIPSNRSLVVVCQHGIRSQQAIEFLLTQKFPNNLINLEGGMAAFSAIEFTT